MKNKPPHDAADQRALSVKEACEYISLGRTSFYKFVKSGQIPARKWGRRTIVLLSELEQALKSLPRAGRAAS
jgi:excisionase family DNA binding protein